MSRPQLNVKLQDTPPYLYISKPLQDEVNLLKSLMKFYVYDDPSLVAQQFGHKKVVEVLFEKCFEVVQKAIKEGKPTYASLIPPPFYENILSLPNDDIQITRLVTDFITSITEQQAIALYGRISGSAPGSILDRIVL